MPLPLRAVATFRLSTYPRRVEGSARWQPGTGQGATACGSFLTPLELRNARTLCPMAAGRIVPVIVTPIRPSPVSARVFFCPQSGASSLRPARPMGRVTRATPALRIKYLRSGRGRGPRSAARARGDGRRRRTGMSTRCLPRNATGRFRNAPPRSAIGRARHTASRPIGCRFTTVGGRGAPGPVQTLWCARAGRSLRIVHLLPACVRCGGASSARDPWEQA